MKDPVDDPTSTPVDTALVSLADAGARLDRVAAKVWPQFSRSRLQAWITGGYLVVDGVAASSKSKLIGGETLSLAVPAEVLEAMEPGVDETRVRAEPVPLKILYEDESITVLDKAAGLVMHPASGHAGGTVMNGLVHRDPALRGVPRAGIVHRLDRDTSGVCVVARTLQAQTALVRQLQSRDMGREYVAVVIGHPAESGSVNQPIGRHSRDRKRMAVVSGGKPAVSHFEVVQTLAGAARLDVRLETGRTHQIRVHMTSLGHPLVGDPVYVDGRALAVNHQKGSETRSIIDAFARQALHARRLTLIHPTTRETMVFDSPVPKDIEALCESLSP